MVRHTSIIDLLHFIAIIAGINAVWNCNDPVLNIKTTYKNIELLEPHANHSVASESPTTLITVGNWDLVAGPSCFTSCTNCKTFPLTFRWKQIPNEDIEEYTIYIGEGNKAGSVTKSQCDSEPEKICKFILQDESIIGTGLLRYYIEAISKETINDDGLSRPKTLYYTAAYPLDIIGKPHSLFTNDQVGPGTNFQFFWGQIYEPNNRTNRPGLAPANISTVVEILDTSGNIIHNQTLGVDANNLLRALELSPGLFTINQTYKWKVRAKYNDVCYSNWSDEKTFIAKVDTSIFPASGVTPHWRLQPICYDSDATCSAIDPPKNMSADTDAGELPRDPIHFWTSPLITYSPEAMYIASVSTSSKTTLHRQDLTGLNASVVNPPQISNNWRRVVETQDTGEYHMAYQKVNGGIDEIHMVNNSFGASGHMRIYSFPTSLFASGLPIASPFSSFTYYWEHYFCAPGQNFKGVQRLSAAVSRYDDKTYFYAYQLNAGCGPRAAFFYNTASSLPPSTPALLPPPYGQNPANDPLLAYTSIAEGKCASGAMANDICVYFAITRSLQSDYQGIRISRAPRANIVPPSGNAFETFEICSGPYDGFNPTGEDISETLDIFGFGGYKNVCMSSDMEADRNDNIYVIYSALPTNGAKPHDANPTDGIDPSPFPQDGFYLSRANRDWIPELIPSGGQVAAQISSTLLPDNTLVLVGVSPSNRTKIGMWTKKNFNVLLSEGEWVYTELPMYAPGFDAPLPAQQLSEYMLTDPDYEPEVFIGTTKQYGGIRLQMPRSIQLLKRKHIARNGVFDSLGNRVFGYIMYAAWGWDYVHGNSFGFALSHPLQ